MWVLSGGWLGGPTTPSLHWPVASYQATPHSSLVSSPGGRAEGESSSCAVPLPRTPPEINWSGSGPVQPRLTRPRQGRGATRCKSAEPDGPQAAHHHLALPPLPSSSCLLLPVTHLCIGSCRERQRRMAESADPKPVSKSRLQCPFLLELQTLSQLDTKCLMYAIVERRGGLYRGNARTLCHLATSKVHQHQSK